MPKLSITIPTFNSASTIERCQQSIAIQSFTDYEVIAQDGSPNDDTVHAIEEFQQSHKSIAIRIHHEPDRGVYEKKRPRQRPRANGSISPAATTSFSTIRPWSP